MMTWTGEVRQDGLCLATVDGADEDAVRREVFHYVMQYAQDGPVEVSIRFNGLKSTPHDASQTLEKIGGPGRT